MNIMSTCSIKWNIAEEKEEDPLPVDTLVWGTYAEKMEEYRKTLEDQVALRDGKR